MRAAASLADNRNKSAMCFSSKGPKEEFNSTVEFEERFGNITEQRA
jgi:hypothetical protein